jgi:HEAT repeat protein/beta-lactamase regulating signal transducer with metallopeptidase domain
MNPFDLVLHPSLTTVEVLLNVVLIQVAVLSVLFFMRRASAANQHLLLTVSLLMILAVTLVTPLVPSRPLGLVPVKAVAPTRGLPSFPGPALGESPRPGNPAPGEEGVGRTSESASREEEAGAPALGGALPGTLGMIWGSGTLLFLIWIGIGLLYSWRLSARARAPAENRARDLFCWALESMGLRPDADLVESDELRVPVVFGFRRPKVILPSRATEWPDTRLRAVLLHESAHIRRRDLFFQLLAKVACALFWFNPLAWIHERRLFLASEKAADDQVVGRGGTPSDYAEPLLEASMELGTERNPVWATAAMAEGTAFKERILSLLDPNIRRGEPPMLQRGIVVLSAAVLVFPLLAFSPWTAPISGPSGPGASFPTAAGEAAAPRSEVPSPPQTIPQDLATLLAMLRMEDPDMREHAATALGRRGDVLAVGALMAVVTDDPDARVREHACTALGELGDARAALSLMHVVLSDPDPSVREHGATALGRLDDTQVLESLLVALTTDASARVREHASTALGRLGDERARHPLMAVMQDDPDPAVREHAAVALGRIGGSESFDVLLAAMYGQDTDRVRAHAAYALGLLGDPRALEPLIAALREGSVTMRMNAALGLGELGDARALGPLRAAERDPEPDVRRCAAESVQKLRRR